MKLSSGIILLAGFALLSGCEREAARQDKSAAENAGKSDVIQAFVSILPQAYFVERVGGERVHVEALVGAGQSPHTYAPTPQQVAGLERCDAYFSIGLPFEERLLAKVTATLPHLNVVDCRDGIELRMMEGGDAHHHEHDAEETHEAAGGEAVDHSAADDVKHEHGASISAAEMDPHIWLDPKRVKIIAETICGALCRLDPEHRAEYQANLAKFQEDLAALDARITRVLAPLKGREFYVFHPAYGYFGDSYGLKQVPVEIEGKDPTPQQLASLISKAKAADVKVIFVQPQFSAVSAQAVAREIGGVVTPLDDLSKDYLKNMDAIANKLAEALGAAKP